MICHQNKCIFIHIPKNAGQSIEQVFVDLLDLKWEGRAPLLLRPKIDQELGPPRLAHLKAKEYVKFKHLTQEMFEDYFKFAFVRNPWSRTVSLYRYFSYFGLTKLDFKGFLLSEFKNIFFINKYWFVGPQSDFLYSEEGKLLVDFVGRFEKLQTDFNYVCKKLGISPIKLSNVNSSKLHYSSHKNHHQNYQEYYDQECKKIVSQLYQKDIELLGYSFSHLQ